MALDASPSPVAPGLDSSGAIAVRLARWRRPGFWGAVAGMALAVALACGVVATEMVGLYGNRASHFLRKMDRLQARISQMQARLASANNQVAEMRREEAYHDEFERIFAASDSRLVRLEPRDRKADMGGALVFSRRLAAAALDVTGLPSLKAGGHYAAWWISRQGPPVLAGELDSSDRKTPDAVTKLTVPPAEAVAVMVSLQAAGANDRAGAAQVLRGEIHKAAARGR